MKEQIEQGMEVDVEEWNQDQATVGHAGK